MESEGRPRVAVIGSGVSGLTAAYALRQTHEVTLFERGPRFGGHAHTHTVPLRTGGSASIDSGFIVHNERTYPTLLRIFRELDVQTQPTEMSMSVECRRCRLTYSGGRGAAGIFTQRRRLADPRFLRMLADVPRFHREARAVLADPEGGSETWGEFLMRGSYSGYFIRHFAIPLVSCVWSSGDRDSRRYPARHLFAFLDNHGMLSIGGSPTWRTVVGGSSTYVRAIIRRLPATHLHTPVVAVRRHHDRVDVTTADGGTRRFDQVVIAVHADEAAALLVDASDAERGDLQAFSYSANPTWLHRDASVLPAPLRARSSWNYRIDDCRTDASTVLVSYWMNRLHGLELADDHVVTLNPGAHVDPASVIARMDYRHPVFTPAAVAAAPRIAAAGGPRLAFAGAHLGWGFHEDGARSGMEAAARLGAQW